MTRRRKFAIVSLLVSSAFVATTGLLELGARLLGFRPTITRRYQWLRVPDPVRGAKYVPNAQFQYLTTLGRVHGTTDADGFRPLLHNREEARSPVILCVGDSFTFNAESPDERTWPEELSRSLSRIWLPCRALNRGVTGYNALQCLITLRETLRTDSRAPFACAVVYKFCINDPVENIVQTGSPHLDPREFSERPELSDSETRTILPPQEWSNEERVPRSLIRYIRDHSALLNALIPTTADSSPADFKAGAKNFVDRFLPYYRDFLSDVAQQGGMRFALRELSRECASRGLPLFVVPCIVPAWDGPGAARRSFIELLDCSEREVESQAALYDASFELLARMCAQVGAKLVDLRGGFQDMSCRELTATAWDWHYSTALNERLGSLLAAKLKTEFEGRDKR